MAHYAKVEDGVVTQVIVADSKEVGKHYIRTMQALVTLGMALGLLLLSHLPLGL